MSETRHLLAALSLLALTVVSRAKGLPAGFEPVPLKNGISTFDLGSDHMMVTLAHRENFNAHSSEIAFFYLRTRAVDSDPKQWQFVPIERKSGEPQWQDGAYVGGGADCQTVTFRLLRKRNTACLLIARRAMEGKTYFDPGRVTFEYYKLTFNTEGLIGWPVAYFKLFQTDQSVKEYCDVDKAIKAELSLGGAMAPKD